MKLPRLRRQPRCPTCNRPGHAGLAVIGRNPGLTTRVFIKEHPVDVVDAEETARKLLLSKLNPDQRDQYAHTRTFMVTGSKGGRYRVRPSGYVEDSATGDTFCIGPDRTWLPPSDIALSHKLILETNEPLWLKTANRLPRTFPY